MALISKCYVGLPEHVRFRLNKTEKKVRLSFVVYTLDDEFHIGPKSGEKYTHLSKG